MNSLNNLKESMGCNTVRDDHNGGVVYQRVHMDKAAFDEMLAEVEEECSGLQAENAKLRELSKYAILCSEGDVRCEACPYHDKTREPHIICTMRKAARELRVEVTE